MIEGAGQAREVMSLPWSLRLGTAADRACGKSNPLIATHSGRCNRRTWGRSQAQRQSRVPHSLPRCLAISLVPSAWRRLRAIPDCPAKTCTNRSPDSSAQALIPFFKSLGHKPHAEASHNSFAAQPAVAGGVSAQPIGGVPLSLHVGTLKNTIGHLDSTR